MATAHAVRRFSAWTALAAPAAGLLIAAWGASVGSWWLAALGAVGAAYFGYRFGRGLSSPPAPVSAPAASAEISRTRPPQLATLAPLLEALPDPALLIDAEGRIAASNAAARRQLEFEAQGLRLSAILRHPELIEGAQAAAQHGATRTVDYPTAAPVEEHFKAYIAPVAWGDSMGALMVFHDQTAMMATERLRADFLANASHELKTPLASLTLLIETLAGHARGDPAAQTQFLALMQAQAGRMRRLIDDLLSLSKIELNEHVPPTGEADLDVVAQEAAAALSPVAEERGVVVTIRREDGAVGVLGDRFQLAQVAQNLIDNAIKYSRRGGVVTVIVGGGGDRDAAAAAAGRRWGEAGRISLLTAPPAPERIYAFLRVEDQGVGIARRYLPRLTERFFRVEREDNPERDGTGLGLAIVKHIVNRHRGGFLVESIVDKGSAFAVLLPLHTRAKG
jgi:two-component system phosphate regulon sensor histidine kinase PhoR